MTLNTLFNTRLSVLQYYHTNRKVLRSNNTMQYNAVVLKLGFMVNIQRTFLFLLLWTITNKTSSLAQACAPLPTTTLTPQFLHSLPVWTPSCPKSHRTPPRLTCLLLLLRTPTRSSSPRPTPQLHQRTLHLNQSQPPSVSLSLATSLSATSVQSVSPTPLLWRRRLPLTTTLWGEASLERFGKVVALLLLLEFFFANN